MQRRALAAAQRRRGRRSAGRTRRSTRPSSASPTGTDAKRAARDDAVAGPDAGRVAERHRQQAAVAKADDFDRQRRIARRADHLADFADARARTDRLDQQADDADDAAA